MPQDITIVIPSYNRPTQLRNAIAYWAAYPVRVLVLDGSSSAVYTKLDSLPKNIKYHHLPFTLEERFLFASAEIKSDFAALASDDELYLYSALTQGANILKKENDVSAVNGICVGFKNNGTKLTYHPEYLNNQFLSISSNSAGQRIEERTSVAGSNIFYSLMRASTLQVALEFIGESAYSCPYVGEYQMESIICGSGKVKFLPNLWWFRNRCVKMVNTDKWNRSVSFVDWVKNPKNLCQVRKLQTSFEYYFSKVSAGEQMSGAKFIELFSNFESNCEGQSANLNQQLVKASMLYNRKELNDALSVIHHWVFDA